MSGVSRNHRDSLRLIMNVMNRSPPFHALRDADTSRCSAVFISGLWTSHGVRPIRQTEPGAKRRAGDRIASDASSRIRRGAAITRRCWIVRPNPERSDGPEIESRPVRGVGSAEGPRRLAGVGLSDRTRSEATGRRSNRVRCVESRIRRVAATTRRCRIVRPARRFAPGSV